METLQYRGYMTTFMKNAATGAGGHAGDEFWDDPSEIGSYDPDLGGRTPWDRVPVPPYVQEGATDSAAAASAMYAGEKTCKYCLNVVAKVNGYPAHLPFSVKYLPTIVEYAEAMGKATGVVTSVNFNHATAAAAVVKTQYRKNHGEKARQMIYSDVDVIMGGGHPCYDRNGKQTPCDYRGFSRNEGPYLADEDGGSLYKRVTHGFKGRTYVETKPDFEDLGDGDGYFRGKAMPIRVFGLAQVAATLQQDRHRDDGDPSDDWKVGGQAFVPNVPSLEIMTRGALEVLEQDEDGFWLMVEGGAIDWACHANDMTRMLEEVIDFDRAVQAVIDWVEDPSNGGNWENTLVIVTADHECGHLQPAGDVTGDAVIQNQCWGVDCTGWDDHTNSLVPIYAQGPGAKWLRARFKGDYRDNTGIFWIMHKAMHGHMLPLEK
jgi:alkaline phosphatase